MKLLYITNGITGSGGLERVLSIKASLLAEEYEYDVTILGLNNGNDTPFYEFSSKIKFRSIPVTGNIFNYIKQYKNGMKRIVDEIQPDVISVCDDGLKGLFLPLLLRSKIPVIYERHASIQLNFSNRGVIKWKQKLTHQLMQMLGKNFNAFVVLTNGNIKEWRLKNIKVIANPLSFYPETSSDLNAKRIIAVGSHSYNKGYDLLFKAWQQIINEGGEAWKLHIYGNYGINQTFIKLADELGISNHIIFSNPVTDIEQEYLKSSIMVLPSRSEGFGMVLIEAMACGVPCVSFDCPHGPGDIISNGQDGLLVKNGDYNSLATAIIRLVQDQELRMKMGNNARENVKRYLPENVLPQWDTLFKQLIAKKQE